MNGVNLGNLIQKASSKATFMPVSSICLGSKESADFKALTWKDLTWVRYAIWHEWNTTTLCRHLVIAVKHMYWQKRLEQSVLLSLDPRAQSCLVSLFMKYFPPMMTHTQTTSRDSGVSHTECLALVSHMIAYFLWHGIITISIIKFRNDSSKYVVMPYVPIWW